MALWGPRGGQGPQGTPGPLGTFTKSMKNPFFFSCYLANYVYIHIFIYIIFNCSIGSSFVSCSSCQQRLLVKKIDGRFVSDVLYIFLLCFWFFFVLFFCLKIKMSMTQYIKLNIFDLFVSFNQKKKCAYFFVDAIYKNVVI